MQTLSLALMLATLASIQEGALNQSPFSYESRELLLGQPLLGAALCDPDADGILELLIARYFGIELWSFEKGELPALATVAELPREPSRVFSWCVAPSRAGPRSVYILRDKGEVVLWRPRRDPEPALVVLHQDPSVRLPSGVAHLPFARDFNGDGTTDLVLPTRGGLALWIGTPGQDAFVRGPLVRHDVDVRIRLPEPEDVAPELSQRIFIPSFEMEDQNGDGHPDLVFRDEERMRFFWTGPDGMLPEEATFELDLKALEEGLPRPSLGTLNPANLFASLEGMVSQEVHDFDGDGFNDLLLRQGRKVSLFAGTKNGFDRSKAVQVLKTAGNLLAAFSADDNGDGKRDLYMLRVDDISLGEALLWFVTGGSVHFDLFAYHQEKGLQFARQPSRRRELTLSFPPVLSLADRLESSGEEFSQTIGRIPVLATLHADGRRNDLVVLNKNRDIELYPDVAEEGPEDETYSAWLEVLHRYDAKTKDKSSLKVDMEQIFAWVPVPGSRRREWIEGRTPAQLLRVEGAMPESTETQAVGDRTERLVSADLNGDGREDFLILIGDTDDGPFRLRVFLSRP